MARATIDIDTEHLRDELEELEGDIEDGIGPALEAVGEFIISKSKKMTPVDNSNLINSAYVGPAEMRPSKTRVFIGYKASYAAPVHEATEEKLRGQPRTGATSRGHYWDGPNGKGSAESQFLLKAMTNHLDEAGDVFVDTLLDQID